MLKILRETLRLDRQAGWPRTLLGRDQPGALLEKVDQSDRLHEAHVGVAAARLAALEASTAKAQRWPSGEDKIDGSRLAPGSPTGAAGSYPVASSGSVARNAWKPSGSAELRKPKMLR